MKDLTVAISYRPSFTRTLVKTLSYKTFALIAMLIIMYWRTHSYEAALAVGGLDLVIKTIIYIIHERVWAHIDTGKLPAQE
jgi:uncharacterized membrane protein